ncbi:dihydroneopterin aldolase [Bradyrhizobium sp. CW1]|uniref:dihydroneopterin aldolase n=1 Tax=Bradyrhizobium sp. CW1 TaxID=2782686 RepID=UPI001FFF3D5D|nr:dihydroneopterin aldolase [Bradyrhizobium sp. CW1]
MQPGLSDNVNDTIDYSEVVTLVMKSFAASGRCLLEPLAAAIAEELLRTYAGLDAVTVTVHKPHAPVVANFDDVGVRTTRRRPSTPP